jgi:peptidoglycan hydrolase CwlO-like protein
MKFIAITTLALSTGVIAATSNSESSNLSDFNIKQYINSEQIYDSVQKLAAIPKDDFIRELNSQVDQIQPYIEYMNNFVEHVQKLTPEQEEKIKELWAEVGPKYTSKPLPNSLEELKKLATPDVLKLYGIVCNSYSTYLLSYFF